MSSTSKRQETESYLMTTATATVTTQAGLVFPIISCSSQFILICLCQLIQFEYELDRLKENTETPPVLYQ